MTLTNSRSSSRAEFGALRAELNRVKRQVAEYRRRIERLRESDLLDPEQIEREVAEEFAERLRAGAAGRGAGRARGPADRSRAAAPAARRRDRGRKSFASTASWPSGSTRTAPAPRRTGGAAPT